ncbi:MAG: CinA family protein [Treponema sp.]|nr:CinA family protein [Treponema sp.]
MPETPELLASQRELASQLVECLTRRHYTLALAESCTAGLVADMVAQVSGASAVLWGSFVCYSPDAKQRMLGIDGELLRQYGLVSRETVRAMAVCALEKAGVSIAAAVTGIAGPLGDGSDTPVGTVWIAVAQRGLVQEQQLHLEGTRAEVRMKAAAAVLEGLLNAI